MKAKMSDQFSEAMPGVLNNREEDGEILTISLFNNNENVDELKNKLKELAVDDVGACDGSLNNSFNSDTRTDVEDGSLNAFSSQNERGVHQNGHPYSFKTEPTELLGLSTETLIDNVDGYDHDSKSETLEHYQRPRNLSGSGSDSMSAHSNSIVTGSSAKVTSGLLISPSSLTQDVHVTMGEDKQRMSAVLDSLDLHLVYIPTTQQLVATKKNEASNVNGKDNGLMKNGKADESHSETDSSGYVSAYSNSQTKQTSNSPLKMATTDSSSVHSIQLLSPGTLDDSSSVNETDCLIRINEPNESHCDSSDFLCNFPRINTNDSLLRTFTDASSLSSLSTGTDFSVSAASLDDGEGTGHCIDTGDGGFMEINLHSKNTFERGKNPSQDSGFEDKCTKPKRSKGFSGLLSRLVYYLEGEDLKIYWICITMVIRACNEPCSNKRRMFSVAGS